MAKQIIFAYWPEQVESIDDWNVFRQFVFHDFETAKKLISGAKSIAGVRVIMHPIKEFESKTFQVTFQPSDITEFLDKFKKRDTRSDISIHGVFADFHDISSENDGKLNGHPDYLSSNKYGSAFIEKKLLCKIICGDRKRTRVYAKVSLAYIPAIDTRSNELVNVVGIYVDIGEPYDSEAFGGDQYPHLNDRDALNNLLMRIKGDIAFAKKIQNQIGHMFVVALSLEETQKIVQEFIHKFAGDTLPQGMTLEANIVIRFFCNNDFMDLHAGILHGKFYNVNIKN
ncbi:hypothetical protein HY637_05380 [Candidatus Woesearchaeota archaeon]|nr:hypothetical protein [Candidatus Woesearchaeota archaeon]